MATTTAREAKFAIYTALKLAQLMPSLREQIRTHEDLISAAAFVLERVALYEEAWRQHPCYEEAGEKDPLNPVCRAIYYHPPGVDGLRHSYSVAGLNDLLSPSHTDWARRTLGTLLCLAPVESDTPIHLTRILSYSNSYLSSGLAYRARLRLKELLPKELHRLINEARRVKSRPKHDFLKRGPEMPLRVTRANPPEWYRTKTKKQIWLELELKPEQRAAISRYMDPSDFWDCATGLIRPEDVHLYLRQMSLIQIEPRKRPPQPRQPKPPAPPPPPASEQQSLFT